MKDKRFLTGIFIFAMFSANVSFAHAMSTVDIVDDINTARSNQGLAKYVVNKKLEKAAELKLEDMQKDKYWSHSNPKTSIEWWRIGYLAGVRGKVAENLARGYAESKLVIRGWDASPSHRSIMLSNTYHKVGVAIGEVDYPEGKKLVVVAEFGD